MAHPHRPPGPLAHRPPSSPRPKHTVSVASNSSRLQIKYKAKKKEARAKGIRTREKKQTQARPHLGSLSLEVLQRPDVLVSQDTLFTQVLMALAAREPLSSTHTRAHGLSRSSATALSPGPRLPGDPQTRELHLPRHCRGESHTEWALGAHGDPWGHHGEYNRQNGAGCES